MIFLLLFLGITRRDRKTIAWIRSQAKVLDIIEKIKLFKWEWAGRTSRRQDSRWSKNTLQWCPRDLKRTKTRPQV